MKALVILDNGSIWSSVNLRVFNELKRVKAVKHDPRPPPFKLFNGLTKEGQAKVIANIVVPIHFYNDSEGKPVWTRVACCVMDQRPACLIGTGGHDNMFRTHTGMVIKDKTQDGRYVCFENYEDRPCFDLATPRKMAELRRMGCTLECPHVPGEGSPSAGTSLWTHAEEGGSEPIGAFAAVAFPITRCSAVARRCYEDQRIRIRMYEDALREYMRKLGVAVISTRSLSDFYRDYPAARTLLRGTTLRKACAESPTLTWFNGDGEVDACIGFDDDTVERDREADEGETRGGLAKNTPRRTVFRRKEPATSRPGRKTRAPRGRDYIRYPPEQRADQHSPHTVRVLVSLGSFVLMTRMTHPGRRPAEVRRFCVGTPLPKDLDPIGTAERTVEDLSGCGPASYPLTYLGTFRLRKGQRWRVVQVFGADLSNRTEPDQKLEDGANMDERIRSRPSLIWVDAEEALRRARQPTPSTWCLTRHSMDKFTEKYLLTLSAFGAKGGSVPIAPLGGSTGRFRVVAEWSAESNGPLPSDKEA